MTPVCKRIAVWCQVLFVCLMFLWQGAMGRPWCVCVACPLVLREGVCRVGEHQHCLYINIHDVKISTHIYMYIKYEVKKWWDMEMGHLWLKWMGEGFMSLHCLFPGLFWEVFQGKRLVYFYMVYPLVHSEKGSRGSFVFMYTARTTIWISQQNRYFAQSMLTV